MTSIQDREDSAQDSREELLAELSGQNRATIGAVPKPKLSARCSGPARSPGRPSVPTA